MKWIRPQGTVTDLMSHSRFHLYWKYVLRRAWLSLWNKHMLPTGSIGYHISFLLCVSGGIVTYEYVTIHTMHRVRLLYAYDLGLCFHSYSHEFDDVHLRYSDAMYPCSRLSHAKGANSLCMVLFSSLVRLCFVSHNIHHYSSSESLVSPFQSPALSVLSMDRRPETSTFSRSNSSSSFHTLALTCIV